MKCAKCGADLPADARFCPACGATSDPSAAAPAANPPSAADLFRNRAADQRTAAATLPAENVLWQGTYSPKDMAGPFLTVGAISAVAIISGVVYRMPGAGWLWMLGAIALVWAALGLQLLYRRMSIRYRLTDQRFFHERGILTRVVDRIEVID